VASDSSDSEGQAEASHGPRECMPCRGSGQVISNLGGTPSKVTCPWCAGGGVRVAGVDAQARWRSEQDEESAPGAEDESPEPAA
jgi:DnaJ-class molecular chaperone